MRLAYNLVAVVAVLAAAGAGVSFRAAAREAAAEAAYPPEGRLLTVDGVRVHAVVAGSGPDLVLLHGAGGSARDFTFDLVERLRPHYRVIAFDRPGHGHTAPTGPGGEPVDSPQAQARLLLSAAAQLGVSRPLVVGHSFGGAVAMAWGLAAPNATAGLVILSGATMPWEGTVDAQYRINASSVGSAVVVPLVSGLIPLALAERVLETVFAPQTVPAGYADHLGLAMSLRREALRANARQVFELRGNLVEMSAGYAELNVPVAVLHGDADRIVGLGVHAEPLTQALPDATLTVLAGVGHMPHHVDRAAVVAAIDQTAERAGLR